MILYVVSCCHDDIIKWKHFPRYWPFVRGIHRSPVNSPHTGQWHGALMFSLICAWMNGWVSSREAGDLRCHCAHYDVTVMVIDHVPRGFCCTGYVNHKYLAVQFQYMQDLCLWNLVIIAPSDPVKKPYWDISKGLLWQVTWVLEEPMMATVLHQECRGNGLGCRGVKTMRWLRCITVMVTWASWPHQTQASQLFVQQLGQAGNLCPWHASWSRDKIVGGSTGG